MKSVAYPGRIISAFAQKSAFYVGAIVVLTASCLAGCTSRKQYAINEAILISERRQLEDEIYRAKFELRDALRENEQLREQLEKEGLVGSSSSDRTNASRKPTIDETLYPGGAALQVDQAKTAPSYQRAYDPERYDSSPTQNVETLPDFVPVPAPRAKSKLSRASAPEPLRQASARVPVSGGKSFGIAQPVDARSAAPQKRETVEEAVSEVEELESDWSPVGLQ